jgi:hypothetical protein
MPMGTVLAQGNYLQLGPSQPGPAKRRNQQVQYHQVLFCGHPGRDHGLALLRAPS